MGGWGLKILTTNNQMNSKDIIAALTEAGAAPSVAASAVSAVRRILDGEDISDFEEGLISQIRPAIHRVAEQINGQKSIEEGADDD